MKIFMDSDFKRLLAPDGHKKRLVVNDIIDYVENDSKDVCIVTGLKRTGKTTAILDAISEMPPDLFKRCAYIIADGENIGEMLSKIEELEIHGKDIIFVDEATRIKDLDVHGSMLYDGHTVAGSKIILSGTDSLVFNFLLSGNLFGKTRTIRTTYIPFSEYTKITGIDSIDAYMACGGIFFSKNNFPQGAFSKNAGATIFQNLDWKWYLNISVVENVINSLRNIYPTWQTDEIKNVMSPREIKSAIERIVLTRQEDFIHEILSMKFVPYDFDEAVRNATVGKGLQYYKKSGKLNSSAPVPVFLAEKIDRDRLRLVLKEKLGIMDPEELSDGICDSCLHQLEKFLRDIDLVRGFPTLNADGEVSERMIFTQPALRWSLTVDMVDALIRDRHFSGWASSQNRLMVYRKLIQGVQGRLLEDAIALELQARVGGIFSSDGFMQKYDIFRFNFSPKMNGEYDIVIFDVETSEYVIFEIKHSKNQNDGQLRWLASQRHLDILVDCLGSRNLVERYVVYNGKACHDEKNGVTYLNAVEFLTDPCPCIPGMGNCISGEKDFPRP